MYKMNDFLERVTQTGYQPISAQQRIEQQLFDRIRYFADNDPECLEWINAWFMSQQKGTH